LTLPPVLPTPILITPQLRESLLQRLDQHNVLAGASQEELGWLIDNGELRQYPEGDGPIRNNQPVDTMIIILSGRLALYRYPGKVRQRTADWGAGEVTGLMPYSRLTTAIGDSYVEVPLEALEVHRDRLPAMIRDCPDVTARLVHVMLDRARQFTSNALQNEKMASLGRISAGLMHELNNPAAAAARSAKLLAQALQKADTAAHTLGTARLAAGELALVDSLRQRALHATGTGVQSALERADREDELVTWLEQHGVDPEYGQALAESGITTEALDQLAGLTSGPTLDAALAWIAAAHLSQALAQDVERATNRIHDIVSRARRWTYMDKATSSEPGSVKPGIADSIAMLGAKAREKNVAVRIQIPDDLPLVRLYGAELHHVWLNLIDNAIDAVGEGGEVVVVAEAALSEVVIRVIDNGPGIPADVQRSIFDQFFTTKEPGKGTGLGLSIARGVLQKHRGDIVVESNPGRTEFCVRLPAA